MPPALHIRAADAPRISIVGDINTVLLSGEQTGGAFALVQAAISPGAGPPPHTHTREDETFFVLEGRVSFTSDGHTFTAGPGDVVHLPRGTRHTFTADAPARVLVHSAPAGIERMFKEAGTTLSPTDTTPTPVTHESIERLLAAAPRYGITVFPPGT